MPPFPGHSTSLLPRPLLRCYLVPMHTQSNCSSLLSTMWLIPFCLVGLVHSYLFPNIKFRYTSSKTTSLTLSGEGWGPSHMRPCSNHCDGDCHTVSSLSCSSVPLSSELLEHFHFHSCGTEHISWGKMDLQLMFGQTFNQLNSCSLLPSGHVLTSIPTLYYPLRREYQNLSEGVS